MERNQDVRNQAMEDLSLIRQVLDQTAASFSTLAPAFRRLGVLWLVLCLPCFLVQLLDGLKELFPVALAGFPELSEWELLGGLQLALLGVLLVQCLLWQGEKKGFHGFDRKLLTLWQLLLLAFLLFSLLAWAGMGLTEETVYQYGQAQVSYPDLSRLGTFLGIYIMGNALFPGLPLVLTGAILEDRPAWGLGLLVGAVSFCGLLMHFFMFPGWGKAAFTLVGMFWPVVSPASLLLLSWRLRKQPEERTSAQGPHGVERRDDDDAKV